jgi:hypothetical protein
MLEIGTVVKTVYGTIGWVRTEPVDMPSGNQVVSLELLPSFSHDTPTGWVDVPVRDLTPHNLCACASLGFRKDGEVVHTGCDTTRTPGNGRKFLPGHDAKAKSILIKAWGYPMFGGYEHSIAAARDFGFSIQVAKGIDRAEKKARGEGSATKAVMRNLQRADGQRNSQEPIGASFVGEAAALEEFTTAAKAWLRDKTELRTTTIDNADYNVAYHYFREVAGF